MPQAPLLVQSAPAGRDAIAEIVTQARGGETFFAVTLPVDKRNAPRPLPHSVQIVWDVSGSAANRRTDRELALLDASFPAGGDELGDAGSRRRRRLRCAALRRPPRRLVGAAPGVAQASVYDGASNLGAVRHDGVSAESIWFTDGLANYGERWKLAFPVPVFAVSSAASSDPAALNALAEAPAAVDASSSAH